MKKSTKNLINQSNLPKIGLLGEVTQPEAGDGIGFTFIYSDGDCSHLECEYCKEKVERGIANVSRHYMHCLRRPGIIMTKYDSIKAVLDGMSANVS